jgi:hypothetical protein
MSRAGVIASRLGDQVAAHSGGSVRVLPTSPSLSVTLSIDETSRPTLLRSGVTGLLEASVGRWLRFLIDDRSRIGGPEPVFREQLYSLTVRAPIAEHKTAEQSAHRRATAAAILAIACSEASSEAG